MGEGKKKKKKKQKKRRNSWKTSTALLFWVSYRYCMNSRYSLVRKLVASTCASASVLTAGASAAASLAMAQRCILSMVDASFGLGLTNARSSKRGLRSRRPLRLSNIKFGEDIQSSKTIVDLLINRGKCDCCVMRIVNNFLLF